MFWPKSFSSENLATFGLVPKSTGVASASALDTTEDGNNEVSQLAPKSKPKKPTDFESENAKSSRSHCVLCKAKISKDVLRLGINVEAAEVSFNF